MESWEDRLEKTHPVLNEIIRLALGIILVGLTVTAAIMIAAIRGAL